METKAYYLNQAMSFLNGAFNCVKPVEPGYEWISGMLSSHKREVRRALEKARQLPKPKLP